MEVRSSPTIAMHQLPRQCRRGHDALMTALLNVRNLEARYGDTRVLRGVSKHLVAKFIKAVRSELEAGATTPPAGAG